MNQPTSQTKTLRSGEKNGVIQDHPGVQGKHKPRTQSPGPQSRLLLPLCTSSIDPGEATVFIFWDCGFKQEEFICLVLEAQSPKARCWQGHSSSEGSTGRYRMASSSFCCSSIPWLAAASLCLSFHSLLLSLYVLLFHLISSCLIHRTPDSRFNPPSPSPGTLR